MVMAKPSPKFAGNRELASLGAAIREARKQAGLSQESLATDATLDRSYMGGIERGEHNLTLMNLCRISEALQVKPSTLLVAAGL
jgi:transcriptional regulator with XRE-family HTH domain